MTFKDTLENDHLNMITSNEFGEVCINNRNNQVFNVIKTNAYVEISGEGIPISSDKPMFNTSEKFINNIGVLEALDIKQDDTVTIDSKEFYVFDIRPDGIGGLDIYLKDV